MTIGQEFNAYANNLEEEILNLERNVKLLHEINMGGTAIGTGLNAVPASQSSALPTSASSPARTSYRQATS